ncbi:MAG: GCN5-related N-acetyltransferase [Myxococcales bacterium]|nr:GCN5-related N-acetyltransferase [Myxococcales bacterium]
MADEPCSVYAPHVTTVGPLPQSLLGEAQALLAAALPHDPIAVVAEEKLFGDNGQREGRVFGAWQGSALVGVMATAGRWIKLLAVDGDQRRRGIGTELLGLARGDGQLRVMDHPGNYLAPGLDERYREGRAFFAARGFRELGTVENIRAPLTAALTITDVEGYAIHRVEPAERASLLGWIASRFAPVWAFEVARALDGPRRAVHAAWRAGTPVAFAAADGNNQGLGWFGPAGTDPAHRGRRLGEALLVRCLEDVRGLPDAGVIAWIGPKMFYAKTVGAVDDRRFVTLEQE